MEPRFRDFLTYVFLTTRVIFVLFFFVNDIVHERKLSSLMKSKYDLLRLWFFLIVEIYYLTFFKKEGYID